MLGLESGNVYTSTRSAIPGSISGSCGHFWEAIDIFAALLTKQKQQR